MADKTPWRLKADWLEACSCRNGCNCQFEGFPNEGKCEGIFACQVKDGRFGSTALNGLRFVIAFKYPNAIHEGNGHVVLWVDEQAAQEQVDAIATILSGKLGGMPWEAIGGTITKFEGPVRKPVEIKLDGERSSVRVPGAIEMRQKPFKNPVTGKESAVHIVYPSGGFFWNDGAISTTEVMRAEHGDFRLEWPERFASVSEVNWSNQA
jgi:hypothetical protein